MTFSTPCWERCWDFCGEKCANSGRGAFTSTAGKSRVSMSSQHRGQLLAYPRLAKGFSTICSPSRPSPCSQRRRNVSLVGIGLGGRKDGSSIQWMRGPRAAGAAGAAADCSGANTTCNAHDYLQVRGVKYRKPGTTDFLLTNVNLCLPQKRLGLIYGRSGSGKTTLLQLLAGLNTPSEGSITVGTETYGNSRRSSHQGPLSAKAGIVFQFPERYFLTDTILDELVFGWPRRTADEELRRKLTFRLQNAIYAVGLAGIPLDTDPRSLSDGFKRRLALAVQLVRMPDILLLDEPLAGLDWMARAELVRLLSKLKQTQTLIIVSHDLKELTPLVDKAWEMEMGGRLTEQAWPQ